MKSPRRNVLFKCSTVLLTTSMLLAACGQYGDLYMPPDTTKVQQEPQPEPTDDTRQPEETDATNPEDQ